MGNFCRKYCPWMQRCVPWLFQESDGGRRESYKTGTGQDNQGWVGDDYQRDNTSQITTKKVVRAGTGIPLPPPCEQKPKNHYKFVALFDYQGRTKEDLSFRAGDKLEVLDASSEGWWYASLLLDSGSTWPGQKLCGYIPANYVAPDQSIEAEP